jgi:hypothetical protein
MRYSLNRGSNLDADDYTLCMHMKQSPRDNDKDGCEPSAVPIGRAGGALEAERAAAYSGPMDPVYEGHRDYTVGGFSYIQPARPHCRMLWWGRTTSSELNQLVPGPFLACPVRHRCPSELMAVAVAVSARAVGNGQ